jgi:flagellin
MILKWSDDMPVINTNVSALYAQAALTTNARGLNTDMQQLSTGKRINGAADDAAGIEIASRLTSQIRGLNQAIRNANDAISMIQTAEGATDAITNMLQRMRELTIQVGNDTNGADDKAAISKEYAALATEIDRVANSTTWGGVHVLNGGSGSAGTSQSFSYAVDASASSAGIISVSFKSMNIGGSGSAALLVAKSGAASAGFLASDITASGAQTLVGKIDDSIKFVNGARSDFGAAINRLQYTIDNLTNISTNAAASRSRIEDTDYSQATSDLARRNIIQQAATAMLAQANQQPQMVLQLFK